MLGALTWPAVAKYASTANQGELYAVLSRDILFKATTKSPGGIDWSQLVADIESMERLTCCLTGRRKS